jgi:hypothetical protein
MVTRVIVKELGADLGPAGSVPGAVLKRMMSMTGTGETDAARVQQLRQHADMVQAQCPK